MEERTTLEVIAPSVEEALAQGLAQLGLPAESVSVEVLDAGSKGFLGLGGRQVRVRLTVNPTEMGEKPAEPEAKPVRRTPKAEAVPAAAKPTATVSPENDRVLNICEEVVSKLLYHLGLTAQISAHRNEDDRTERPSIHVDIRGDDLGVLIGRRSETLNALQYMASLMVSKQVEEWVQLSVDVEGYRSRRERQIRQMARRMAEQALKTGRRQSLEPMPANERRIVHLELRNHPAVITESVGEEPSRKVTIIPKDS